jgi:hypothetical protein
MAYSYEKALKIATIAIDLHRKNPSAICPETRPGAAERMALLASDPTLTDLQSIEVLLEQFDAEAACETEEKFEALKRKQEKKRLKAQNRAARHAANLNRAKERVNTIPQTEN